MADNDKPAWLERWGLEFDSGVDPVVTRDGLATGRVFQADQYQLEGDDCRLAAAAPDLARALLKVEWRGESRGCEVCVGCQVGAPFESRPGESHESDCFVDVALTKAGFPTAESRDVARAAIDKAGL